MLPLFVLIPLVGLLLLSPFTKGALRQAMWLFALVVCLAQVAGMIVFPAATAPAASGMAGQPMVYNAAPAPVSAPAATSVVAAIAPEKSQIASFFGLELNLNNLGRVTLLSVGIVLAAALFVGRGMFSEDRLPSFASLVLISLIGMNGMTLVTDLFSMYVFLEVTSVGSFILIAFNRDKKALEGAFKYLILSACATLLMLGATALLLMTVGSTSYVGVHAALAGSQDWLTKLAVAAFVCGLLIKGGVVPFHGWVLGAYSTAPAPVSVVLAGIATKASGVFGLIQLTAAVFPHSASLSVALVVLGTLSIVVGAFCAIGQHDLKRLLAYSSISQVGYIIVGLGVGVVPTADDGASVSRTIAVLGLVGATLHMFNHSIFKSLLFVTSSALEQRLGTTDMNKMGGLDTRMPVTSLSSILAMLSTAGVPPLSGFWSKLIIIVALWRAGYSGYAIIAVLMSVVTLAYLLKMQKRVFFGKVAPSLEGVREASGALLTPAIGLALITVVLGLMLPLLAGSFLMPIKSLFE